MKPSSKCYDLVKEFEGFEEKAYLCPAGKWTVGYGFTRIIDKVTGKRRSVIKGDTMSKEEANQFLIDEVNEHYDHIKPMIKVPLNQEQLDAVACFNFNVGAGNFKTSTLLKKINAKDFDGAALEFLKWDKARDPKTKQLISLKGLTRRREAEKELFTA